MLSKVLTGADAARAQPIAFAHAVPAPARPTVERDKDCDGEIENLRAQVRRLESEIPAAKRESFEAGRRQGEQAARADLATTLERMNASIAELAGHRAELRARAEKDLVLLALLIAKRVLHRELNIDPNALTALARVVFERLARAESYKIQVHPQFAQAIQGAVTGRVAARVEIQPDPGLAPGAFVIHSDEGTIDASMDTQLEEISRGLMDRL
ncbi:MAG: hypothetical protein KGN84_01960, partial [Acidobacteriota bacterium]|nr:hypothetical protein [Acidobacteriota bacterium]